MSDFELNGSLQGLKLLEFSDLQRYKSAIKNGSQTGFAYYFPNILAHNRPGLRSILIEEIEGSVCTYRWKQTNEERKLDIFAAPAPMNGRALTLCIERANDYNSNYDARLLKVDEKDCKAVAALSSIRLKKWKTQYIYAPNSFTDLSGSKFRTLRRNVAKIRALDNVEILPYSIDHRKACHALLRKWHKHQKSIYKRNGSIGNTKRLLELTHHLESPDILGEVIFVDGNLAAFSLGGEIRPGYGAFLEAKCDPGVAGLSYFQRYSFLSKLSAFELINDGSDLRRKGLAQLKNSLRPTEMHTEYRGQQREKRKTVVSLAIAIKPDSGLIETSSAPNLTGTLSGLRILENHDLALYQAALEKGAQMGWGYYFPFLMTKNRPGQTLPLVAEEEGSICLFLLQHTEEKSRIDLLLAPAPMSKGVLIRSIERANEFNHDYSARILRIDTKDAKAVSDAGIRIRERKRQYIFSSSNYNDLGGKKYYTLRRNVSHIERLADVDVLSYTNSHFEACHKLLERWAELHRTRHGSAGGTGTSRRILELAGSLPTSVLRGQVIYVGGRLAAYCFGGQIRPGLACSFERKCDNSIRGLSHYQLRNFLRSFDENTLVNDGSDAGSPGLRQLKDGFRPVFMHSEYRGIQRGAKRQ